MPNLQFISAFQHQFILAKAYLLSLIFLGKMPVADLNDCMLHELIKNLAFLKISIWSYRSLESTENTLLDKATGCV